MSISIQLGETIVPEGSTRIFACTKCPKKYLRGDYLERHELNHSQPKSVCEQCGKGFARPDVLRRHQAKACIGEDAGADLGVKRALRSRNGSEGQTSGASMSRERKRRAPSSSIGASSSSQHGGGRHTTEHVAATSSMSAFTSPTSPEKQSSVIADCPDTQPPINQAAFDASTLPLETHLLGAAGGIPFSTDDRNAQPVSSTIVAGQEFDWNPPTRPSEDVDDLFSWLFNAIPDVNTADVVEAPSAPVISTIYTPDEQVSAVNGRVTPRVGNSNITPTQPPSVLLSRQPQPFHPYNVPNVMLSDAYPALSNSWVDSSAWAKPLGRPVLDEEVRAAMIRLFDDDGRREFMSPAFSLQQMKLYLELYFMHFAPSYPIIHRASLEYRRVPPDLLLTMICIGSAFAVDQEGLQIAAKIHKRIRTRILEAVEDEPVAPVSSLQTLLLINYFARSFCSLKQHDVSQRLSGVFLPHYELALALSSDDPMASWLSWVNEEERKRVGWFAFMADTENAALYRHYLLIELPVEESVWNALDPYKWREAMEQSPSQPSWRSALRELAARGTVVPNLNQLSMWILLYGLLSVSWSLLWRDLGDLSMVHDSKITGWKDTLRQAFATWRNHVSQTMLSQVASGQPSSDCYIHTVGIPLSDLGTILLLCETEQIRIFSGTKKIAGRPISPGEWAAANAYVNTWARSQDGAYTCHAAAELLSHVFRWSSEARYQTVPSIIPWALYIATLTIWTYVSVLDGHDKLQKPYIIVTPSRTDHSSLSARIEPSLARADALNYLDKLLDCAHPFALPEVEGKNDCAGIVAYTAYLAGNVRRGITDESKTVLNGLLTEHTD